MHKDDVSRIEKYLRSHAEPEADLSPIARHFNNVLYEHVLVVPAYRENPEALEAVWRNIAANILVVVVANSPSPNDPDTDIMVHSLCQNRQCVAVNQDTQLATGRGPDLLIVSRYRSNPIPKKSGVGLARKIGCDIALRLILHGSVRSEWIHNTDADVELPADYFDQVLPDNVAAVLFPFQHTAEPDLGLATQLYETTLLYYPAGLRWAGSRFGYPTVGSTIAARGQHYATVRGFPKRPTGEDFYLLSKLRKIGDIQCLKGPMITISGRRSDRVPVGTGRAISAIADLQDPGTEYQFDHPDCFIELKRCLDSFADIASAKKQQTNHDQIDVCLEQLGFWQHANRVSAKTPPGRQRLAHLHDWFDGLKTRQFIHYFRDNHHGTVRLDQLADAPFIEGQITSGEIGHFLQARLQEC